ncbi:MAG: outer membrane lipoprotein-sorting protein [candidate division Zixibacteria bacterium]|nr:outer membrane lipoprotein-sorting protein [candidate division Zixibacteria bacterium]
MYEKYSGLKIPIPSTVILSHAKSGRKICFNANYDRFFSRPAKRRDSLRIRGTRLVSLLLLFFSILIFLSCYPAARLKPPPEELTPQKVLERFLLNQSQIKTSSSLINFNYKSKQGNFSGDLELFLKKPDSLAFRVKAFLGPDYLSGVVYSDTLLLYFPRLKIYYKGITQNCSYDSIYENEINLFCLLKFLAVEIQIKEDRAYYVGTDQNNCIYEDSIQMWKRKFWLDKKKSLLRRSIWERLNSFEIEQEKAQGFVIEYKDFGKFSGIKLPQTIEIKSLDGKEKLRLKFLEIQINSSISEKKFQLKIPEDAKPLK